MTPQMVDQIPTPLIKFFPNQANRLLDESLMRSLIFHDTFEFGASYIESQLDRIFPEYAETWGLRALPGNLFVIDPPDKDWRDMVLAKGEIWLGDVCFPLEPYDPYRHDGGMDPIPVWVTIAGLPPRLWSVYEFKRVTDELGGIIIDVDPRKSKDLTKVRLCLGVPDRQLIPRRRIVSFQDEFGRTRFYPLDIALESLPQPVQDSSKGKLYWQEVDRSKVAKAKPASPRVEVETDQASSMVKEISPITDKVPMLEIGQPSSNRFKCLAEEETQDKQAWDPWASSGEPTESDKALVVVPEETRHSLRQKTIQIASRGGRGARGGRRGRGSSQPRSGTPSFVQNFPFAEYTDDELIRLFEVSGFSLGNSEVSKLLVINHLRSLHKDRFDTVMAELIEQQKKSVGTDVFDISIRVMMNGT